MMAAFPSHAGENSSRIMNNNNYDFEDENKPWAESTYTLPAYPDKPDWVGFYVNQAMKNQYFADAKTLTLTDDGVIRLILRIRSPAGAENISYEGIQCQQGTYRTYAFGDTINKRWIESTRAQWRKIEYDDKLRQRLREDMCPEKYAPKSADDALNLLKKAPWM